MFEMRKKEGLEINTAMNDKCKFTSEELNLKIPELLSLMKSRYNNYYFLGYVLYNKLNLENFNNLKIKEYIEKLIQIDSDNEVPGLSYLQEFLNAKEDYQDFIDFTRDEFQKMFEGPGKLLAPPWESVYLSEEKLMFEEQTINVREFYGRYGMQISNFGAEPDDHIGLELQFMALLTKKSIESLEKNNINAFKQVMKAQEDFLTQHLLLWVIEFSDLMYQGVKSPFYRGLALFLPWYLENDAEIISSLGLITYDDKEVKI